MTTDSFRTFPYNLFRPTALCFCLDDSSRFLVILLDSASTQQGQGIELKCLQVGIHAHNFRSRDTFRVEGYLSVQSAATSPNACPFVDGFIMSETEGNRYQRLPIALRFRSFFIRVCEIWICTRISACCARVSGCIMRALSVHD